jgi:hypothetical protein
MCLGRGNLSSKNLLAFFLGLVLQSMAHKSMHYKVTRIYEGTHIASQSSTCLLGVTQDLVFPRNLGAWHLDDVDVGIIGVYLTGCTDFLAISRHG